MSHNTSIGNPVSITVTFRTWSEAEQVSALDDPTTVVVTVKSGDTVVLTDTPTKVGYAVYSYTWTPETDGSFVVEFLGTFEDDSTELISVDILVGVHDTPGLTMVEDYVYEFSGVIEPLYVDPEELAPYFPDATLSEIAEQIWIASSWVQQTLKIPTGGWPENVVAYEYVKAAAACALSGVYGNASLTADSNAESITLGDLRVEYSSQTPNPTGKSNRGTASTWCELAESLRLDLLHSSVGFKAVVKGSRYMNPIPSRKIKPFTSQSEIYYGVDRVPQGLLDGPG